MAVRASMSTVPQVTSVFELVTPKMAKEYLAHLPERQRSLRRTTRRKYANDMANNHWKVTGDGIKFDCNGELIDGMHRLNACIEANTPFPTMVIRNVDPDAMPVMNTGLGQSFADTLWVTRQTLHRNLVGAIIRRIWQWERGNFVGRAPGHDDSPTWEAPTHTELLERLDKEPDGFLDAARRGDDARRFKVGNGTAAGTAFFLFTKIDHEQGHAFFDMLISGANLPEKHPTLTLRNRLIKQKSERLVVREQLALYVRAWNGYREDRPMDKLVVVTSPKGLTNDNFPKPI